ncbi:unnamed protein product [Rotaria sordida]|uniref:Alpha/beta hydrolase fold-3 domain-containing protein n=1 Tax=Rotaria sordida TaxID=392033 RepID=A0A813YBJ4_9BILA|nr:unnamed protein product [Rotaria sordida]CAF3877560.1 unnamed protein product [Rotaria sordida]
MSFLNGLFGLFKKLTLFILIFAIAIPLRYGSTNLKYLQFRVLHSMLSLKYSFVPDQVRPTLSAEYRAFETLLRMNPPSKRDPFADLLTSVKEFRASFRFDTILPKPSQCQVNKEIFEYNGHTIGAYWINNHQKNFTRNLDNVLVYLHGGGYMFGDIQGYSGYECHLSQLFNISVLHVEYRLIPEHPLPSAVEDTVAIYRGLLHNYTSSSQIIIMGDSAGGGLSLLTIQALIAQQLPVPRGIIVLSPWTDLSASGESNTRNHLTDVMISAADSKWIASHVFGPNHSRLSLDSSIVSPLFGSFKGFPPIYINVGTAEILEDDSKRVFKKAQEAGVDVTLEEGLHLMHVYPAFFPYYPEARNTLDNINKWIHTLFDRKHNE